MVEKISQEDYVKELFSAMVHLYSGEIRWVQFDDYRINKTQLLFIGTKRDWHTVITSK